MENLELRKFLEPYIGDLHVMTPGMRMDTRARVEALAHFRTVKNTYLQREKAKQFILELSKVHPNGTLLISGNRDLSTHWAIELARTTVKGNRPALWNGPFYNNGGKRGKSPESLLNGKYDVVVFLDSDNYFAKYISSRTYTNLDRFVNPDVVILKLN